jgi:type IV secretion system protein VirB4
VAQISWFCLFPAYDDLPRVYKLLSRAVACSITFERVPTGFMKNDWGDGNITTFPTANGTSYRFQFHISSASGAVAHSIVIGPTGIGKTTLYAFLCGAAMRYPKLKAFFFDRNRGIEIFTNAVGGAYLTFVGGKTKDVEYGKKTYMNPLKLPDTPENRQFLRLWLKAITYIENSDYAKSEAQIEEEISRAVSVVYDYLDYDLRSLKNIYKSVFSPTGIVRQEIKRWVDDEQYGMLFNSDVDNLDLSSQLTSFDFTNIFEDSRLAAAVISYIMNQINNVTTKEGDPSLIIIDETAPMLENPMFRRNFITGLQEGRKKRQAFMAAFQQPNIIDNLGVGEAIRGQCQTAIFFKNPQATPKDYAGWNLNEKEMAFISGKLYPELRYAVLISRPIINESVILNIDLSSIGNYLKIFDSGRKSVVLADELLKKMGGLKMAGSEKYFGELLKNL